MATRLWVEGRRGGLLETRHEVSAVVVEGGRMVWSVGDDLASYWRSASKPFQLAVSLGCLPGEVVASLTEADLAVGAASHSGQPAHVERVAALLARFCFIEEQLQCGAHWPMHEASARALSAIGNLHNNCSGKHTFMLAASAARGWDLDYRPPHHPLQAMIRDTLDTVSNVSHGVGVDGCSVPTFHAPLSAQARAWTVLAEAMAGTAGDARGDLNGRLSAVGWAMHRNPFWMSGDGRLDKGIVEGASEPLTGKVGAEGLFCIARPNARQGIAVKVHSGSTEALGPALRVVMGELGVGFDGPLSGERVKNVRGVVVGERAGRLG